MEVAFHFARVGGEADCRIDVADLANRLADQAVDHLGGQVGPRGDFAGDHDEVGRDQRLAGDTALGIGRQAMVQNRIADLVCHLVRVAHGDRFTGEKIAFRGHESFLFGMSHKGWASAVQG